MTTTALTKTVPSSWHERTVRYDTVTKAEAVMCDQTKVGSSSYTKNKVSVDTGSFVPNEYRVNPYSVDSVVLDEIDDGSFYLEASPSPYRYVYKTKVEAMPFHDYLCDVLKTQSLPTATFEGQLALQRAHAGVNASLLDLGTELGELRETLKGLANPLESLRDFLNISDWVRKRKALQRFNKTGKFYNTTGRRAAKAAMDTWLELRFGLIPVYNTLSDAVKLVQEGIAALNKESIYCSRGLAREHDVSEAITAPAAISYRMLTYAAAYATARVKKSVKGTASVQFRYTDLPSLTSRFGLDWMYLPEVAWELTRLSFVVDRFLGISPWLGSLRCKPGITILGNTVGVKRCIWASVNSYYANHYYTPSKKVYLNAGDVSATREAYDRTVNVSLGAPQLICGAYLDWVQHVDHLMLIAQSIKF